MPGVTEQVESYYRSLLDRLEPGARLPSERTVMLELHTCRSTVRLVLTKLVAERQLYPIHGKGYFKHEAR
jgi:DNA-binding GntR family transcriptional regulator